MPRSQQFTPATSHPADKAAEVRAAQQAHKDEIARQTRTGQIPPIMPTGRRNENAGRVVEEQQRRQARQLPSVASKTGKAQRGF